MSASSVCVVPARHGYSSCNDLASTVSALMADMGVGSDLVFFLRDTDASRSNLIPTFSLLNFWD